MVNQHVLREIVENLRTGEKEGVKWSASKEEVLRAAFINLNLNDFDEDTKILLHTQNEGFDYLCNEFRITDADIDALQIV